MARKALEARFGERFRVTAMVERYGSKRGYKGRTEETILLSQVRDAESGQQLTGHLWFTAGKSWRGLRAGDKVAFDARVDDYVKGYQGRRIDVFKEVEIDYRLTRPTKVEKLSDTRAA